MKIIYVKWIDTKTQPGWLSKLLVGWLVRIKNR